MTKNPHAVALGRKGGKAKGKPKGFAAMPAAEAKQIRALAAEARRKSADITFAADEIKETT